MDSVKNSASAPTAEQAKVIASKARRIRVNAYAGTGKTTTARGFTMARPNERFLLMAFNKAIADDAKTKFPDWVECKTMHSLAYGAIVPRLFASLPNDQRNAKLGDMRTLAIANVLQISPRMARLVQGALHGWLCSADREIAASHIAEDLKCPPSQHGQVIAYAKQLFAEMCDPTKLDVKLPHDGYLKLWQLTSPDLSRRYTSIICDEAQDLNPTVLDILKRQKTGLLVIGDENQAIYKFRGATNAMRQIQVDETHYLTTSFRFGSGVAAVATALLGSFRDMPRPITGKGKPTVFDIDTSRTYCTISRTNAALFDAAVQALDSNRPFHFVGGTSGYRFDAMMDAYHLSVGDRSSIRDPIIRQFADLSELEQAAKDTDDRDLKFLSKIADGYGQRIPALIRELERRHVPAPSANAFATTHSDGLVFTTAHKSKGLEFDQVLLANDFCDLTDDQEKLLPADNVVEDELNLLYVAATRAERALHLNDGTRSFLRAIQRAAKVATPAGSSSTNHNRSAATSVGQMR